MTRKLTLVMVILNVMALGLLLKDHLFTRTVSASPTQLGAVSGVVVTAGDEISTTSLSYVDVPNMTATISSPGGNLAIMFSVEGVTQSGAEAEFRALVDDKSTEPGDVTIFASPLAAGNGFTFVANNIAPGPHTVKMQWHKPSSSGRALNMQDRTMVVLAGLQ